MTRSAVERLVRITYLEMTSAEQLTRYEPERRLEIRPATVPSPEFARFLYVAVGAEWWWHERLEWSSERWMAYLDRPEVELCVGYWSGTPVGYFELERQADVDVEIAYLGLLPSFIGRGLGAELLHSAVERAWELGPERVWLHTCDLDHPRALPNYEASGFTVYKTEEVVQKLPDERPRLWPEVP